MGESRALDVVALFPIAVGHHYEPFKGVLVSI